MRKHAMPNCCDRLKLNPGVQLRGWPFAPTNGHRRWSGGRESMTQTVSRSRTGATMSLLRSQPVR
jgi:hypothetical protein